MKEKHFSQDLSLLCRSFRRFRSIAGIREPYKYVGLPIITRNYFQLIFYEYLGNQNVFLIFGGYTYLFMGLPRKFTFRRRCFGVGRVKFLASFEASRIARHISKLLALWCFWWPEANMLDLLVLSNWEIWVFFCHFYWVIFKVLNNFVTL